MAEDTNFQELINERPAVALKYVEEFEQNIFWKYYKSKMQKELDESDVHLRTCELDKVVYIRGFRKGIEYGAYMPDKVINTLKDNIALLKEAEKVEAARQPEKQ